MLNQDYVAGCPLITKSIWLFILRIGINLFGWLMLYVLVKRTTDQSKLLFPSLQMVRYPISMQTERTWYGGFI